MSHIEVYIHFVWNTKNREKLLPTKQIRKTVWNHIKENGREKGIYIDSVNGYSDHCHCVVSMGNDQTIRKVMQLIKGESSNWINKNNIIDEKFEWQDEYYAGSVSKSRLIIVRAYLNNQEEHHKTKSFQEELDIFLKKNDFKRNKE